MKSVRYYIDCGDDDFLIKGNMALYAALIDKDIPMNSGYVMANIPGPTGERLFRKC